VSEYEAMSGFEITPGLFLGLTHDFQGYVYANTWYGKVEWWLEERELMMVGTSPVDDRAEISADENGMLFDDGVDSVIGWCFV